MSPAICAAELGALRERRGRCSRDGGRLGRGGPPVGPVGKQLEGPFQQQAPSRQGGSNSRAMPATLLLTASATLAGELALGAPGSRAGRGRPKFRGRHDEA